MASGARPPYHSSGWSPTHCWLKYRRYSVTSAPSAPADPVVRVHTYPTNGYGRIRQAGAGSHARVRGDFHAPGAEELPRSGHTRTWTGVTRFWPDPALWWSMAEREIGPTAARIGFG